MLGERSHLPWEGAEREAAFDLDIKRWRTFPDGGEGGGRQSQLGEEGGQRLGGKRRRTKTTTNPRHRQRIIRKCPTLTEQQFIPFWFVRFCF